VCCESLELLNDEILQEAALYEGVKDEQFDRYLENLNVALSVKMKNKTINSE